MKKIILVLVILTATVAKVFATDVSDALIEELIKERNEKKDILLDKASEINSERKDEQKTKDPLPDKASEISPIRKNEQKTKETLQDKVSEINVMQDDEQKVKAWAKFNSETYYVIINKKDCSATVYNKDGKEINRFEVGIGKEIGDDFNDTRGVLGKVKNTTPAGEYTLIPNIYNTSAYGDLTLSLGAKANKPQDIKKVVAMHKVPKFREKDRLKKFYDGNLANNRMSHGCINFVEEDFKALTKYIHGGLKTYVLPEESDNKLMLTKNDKGKFELTQTKY